MSKLSLSDIAVGNYLLMSNKERPLLIGIYKVVAIEAGLLQFEYIDEYCEPYLFAAVDFNDVQNDCSISIIEEKDIQLIVDVLTKGDKHE